MRKFVLAAVALFAVASAADAQPFFRPVFRGPLLAPALAARPLAFRAPLVAPLRQSVVVQQQAYYQQQVVQQVVQQKVVQQVVKQKVVVQPVLQQKVYYQPVQQLRVVESYCAPAQILMQQSSCPQCAPSALIIR